MDEVTLSVSQFVAVFNQTLEIAYPSVTVIGELANFRISKNKWVYFDLKDDLSSIKFFGTVYQLPGPLQDGMLLKVKASPRLHSNYGFNLNVISIQPTGEGSIKKAAELLKNQLASEGLFDIGRKRALPHPPERIALISSKQSAAYTDFIKILNARWQGVEIEHIDVQVQGESAPVQIAEAIEYINAMQTPPEVLILIRGGGNAEDLAAFSSELVTRSIAGSRVPTLVAVGHERDISLAELAADLRASTPSNAAELLVPDKTIVLGSLTEKREVIRAILFNILNNTKKQISESKNMLDNRAEHMLNSAIHNLELQKTLINAYNPKEILKLGYSIVRSSKGRVIKSISELTIGEVISIGMQKGRIKAEVNEIFTD